MLLEFAPWWKAHLGRPRKTIYLHLLSTSISLLFPHFVSDFSSLLTFIFCFSHLFTKGRRMANNEIIRFKLPHPIQCCKWLKKGPFSGIQLYLFFTTCNSSNTVSLKFIFHFPGCPGMLWPFSHSQNDAWLLWDNVIMVTGGENSRR